MKTKFINTHEIVFVTPEHQRVRMAIEENTKHGYYKALKTSTTYDAITLLTIVHSLEKHGACTTYDGATITLKQNN